MQDFLTKYLKRNNNNFGFLLDQIQIIIDVVMLDYKPYLHNELCHTPF